jgi:hypothetical protein
VLGDDEHLPGAATSISELDANRQTLGTGDEEVFVLDLFKFTETDGAKSFKSYVQAVSPLLQRSGAVLELSVSPEIPVLSEETWDYCMLTRFPSLDTVVTL